MREFVCSAWLLMKSKPAGHSGLMKAHPLWETLTMCALTKSLEGSIYAQAHGQLAQASAFGNVCTSSAQCCMVQPLLL